MTCRAPAGFGIKKDEARFTAFVDDVLLDLEKSGEAEKIFNAWFAPVKRPFTISGTEQTIARGADAPTE